MQPQVAALAAIFDLNTTLLLNCLDGLSDAEAQTRLEAGGNMVSRLGRPLPNPLARYLEDVRSIEDIHNWPTLDEIRPAWRAVSAHLQVVLANLSAVALAEPNFHRLPMGDATRLGYIAFLVQHDSYHLGQMAFLRRQLGKSPMSYARPDVARRSEGAA